MFGFFFSRHKDQARQVLSRHKNRDYLRNFRYGPRREARGGFCQPVWVFPLTREGECQFDEGLVLLTKDICPDGISILHTQPLPKQRLMVVIGQKESRNFLVCQVEHSSPIGLGYWQIGIQPEAVHVPVKSELARLQALEAAIERMSSALQPAVLPSAQTEAVS